MPPPALLRPCVAAVHRSLCAAHRPRAVVIALLLPQDLRAAAAVDLTPDFFTKQNPNFFDEVWKEYIKGDSRYVARDTATVTVEGITAVLEGPASLLVVYAIASRKSYSHILQFTVCLGQLYGCLVYFITAYLDGFHFWVSPFYFWAYFIGANSSWVVIPTLVAARSRKKICAAIHQGEKKKTK